VTPVQTGREPGDAELAAAARAGSAAAFVTLVERYEPAVLRYLYHRAGDSQLAADLTQETFLTAWRDLRRLRDERAFAGWLYRIAANQLRMAWRRERRVVSLDWLAERGVPIPGRTDNATATSERDAIGRALATISPKLREALLLHTVWGFIAAEVAKIQSISLAAARKRIGRASEQFRATYNAGETDG
jgi:RNA polymerase sigma-70 factor (ECF subfamily)